MKRFLLDTGIVSDFINRRHGVDVRVREARKAKARVGTCMPVVAELFAGIELSATRKENHERLVAGLRRLLCWPFDRTAAEEYGKIFAELRRQGRLIPIMDMQIAAVALTIGNCTLVSKDTDFAAISGLALENWAV